MNSVKLAKLAVSGLVLGAGLSAGVMLPSNAASASAKQQGQAQKIASLSKAVTKALAKRDAAKAITLAEKLVELTPDAGHTRMMLGEAYLMAGRFTSAETTFADVLALSPGNERAALKLALVKSALAKPEEAQQLLAQHRDGLNPTDFGLAMALAGDLPTAVSTLEAAVRAPTSDAKARQNLALAYALSGRWVEARVVAAQDLSPDMIDARMGQWAQLARPKASWDQVAGLLSVTPSYDPGQPVQLALNASPAAAPEEQLAAVVADPAPVASEPDAVFETQVDAAPVAVAVAEPAPVIEADPAPIKKPVAAPAVLAAKPARQVVASADGKLKMEAGRFAVQLGAFANANVVRDAWARNKKKVGALAGLEPVTTKATVKGKTYTRLAVAGLDRAGAFQLCQQVKSSGGACFVRGDAASSNIQLAKRKPLPAKKPIKLASR